MYKKITRKKQSQFCEDQDKTKERKRKRELRKEIDKKEE